MLSTLRWTGSAVNANSLADPNVTFDATSPCVSGVEAARDTLMHVDEPVNLKERMFKKPVDVIQLHV